MDRNIDQEDLDAARVDILDRMRDCGWITGFAIANGVATCQFTEHGRLMIDSLQKLYTHGGDISVAEMTAFNLFVRNLDSA